jgi:hypothetical protein
MIEIIQILKWPLTAIIIALIFRKRTVDSIHRLKSVKGGKFGFEIDSITTSRVLDEVATEQTKQKETALEILGSDVLTRTVNNLPKGFCRYLIKVDGKELKYEEHADILRKEITSRIWKEEDTGTAAAYGYIMSLWNLQGIIYKLMENVNEGLIIVEVSPQAKNLILIKEKLEI